MKVLESRLEITKKDEGIHDLETEFPFLTVGSTLLIACRRLTTTAFYPGGYKGEEGLIPHNPQYVTDVLERKIYSGACGLILRENQSNSYHGVQSREFLTYSVGAALAWLQELKEEEIGERE